LSSARENKENEKVWRKRKERKRWKEFNTSNVVKVKYLNLDLDQDILCKDLEVKFGGIVEDYNMHLFSNFQKKKMSCESYELLKILCQIWFFDHISFIECFWICNFRILYIIKDYICERNFMSFGYVLKDIQVFKIWTSILKLISFENINSLWSSLIWQKFWKNVEDMYLMCVPKFQGV